jgi:hypothetical protein
MADLTPTDYAFLILLKIESREISNKELDERHGVRLVGGNVARLNGAGYVVSETKRRPYRHTLDPKGAKVLDVPFTLAEDGAKAKENKLNEKEQQLWAALSALHNHHLGTGNGKPALAPVHDGRSLDERIRSAYADLAAEPGAWVSLSRLRPLFGDVSKAELDKALASLLDAPDVDLEPEPNQKTLKPEDRRAAVRIGGEDRHLLAIGMR